MQAGFFLNIASEINLPSLTFKNQLIQETREGLVSESRKENISEARASEAYKTVNAQENMHGKWNDKFKRNKKSSL